MLKQKNRINRIIAFAISCVLLLNTCLQITPVEVAASDTSTSTSSKKCMQITSKELSYNSTQGYRTLYASSFASTDIYVNARTVQTDKTYGTVAMVVHVPETFEGTSTMELNVKLQRRYGSSSTTSTSAPKFRVVKSGEIVYPTDGTWADVSASWSGITINGVSFEATAGDDIYFILYDSAKKSNYAAFYMDADMTIDGMTFDSSALDYSKSDPSSESYTGNTETSSFFGGTYKYSDLITYEYITSWYDYDGAEESLNFDNYDKKSVYSTEETFAMNATSGNRRCWLSWGDTGNWEGAEYFVVNVSNPSTSDSAGLKFEFYENNSAGYGISWYVAHYTDYYLFGTDGAKMKLQTSALSSTNCGLISIPAGFEGQLIIPITSLEHSGWLLPYVSGYPARYNRYGEPNVIHLDKFAFYDVYYVTTNTSATETFTVSNAEVWGSYIPSVTSTYKTVIQAIDNIGNVSVASESQIVLAKELYDALSESDKALVTNYETLENAISEFEALEDYSGYVGTKGKDFTGTNGAEMTEILSESPATISAWIKVDKDVADKTHVGTIIGNMERDGTSQYVVDASRTMSMEITTNGNPKFTWKISNSNKVTFIVKNIDVRTGNWLNLTFVRDTENLAIYCYVNGVKVATKEVDASDIANFTFVQKPLLIGSDYTNDEIMAPTYTPDFNGKIANVRLYSDVLSDEQVATNVTGSVSDVNLMHDVDFYEGEESYWDNANNEALEDTEGWIENGGEKLAAADYSIAILGDTQMMLSRAVDGNGNGLYVDGYDETSNVFYKNIQWLIQNKEKLNLQFVMHVGDLTDNGNNSTTASYTYTDEETGEETTGTKYKYDWEYKYGLKWLNQLHDAEIPYALVRGNHETSTNFQEYYVADETNTSYVTADTTVTDEEGNETVISGMLDSTSMLNTAYTFEVNNQKYLIVALDLEPSDEALEWANNVVAAHPEHRTIILTHAYMNGYGVRYQSKSLGGTNYGEIIWDELASQHENIFLVICGHASEADIIRRTDVGVNGNTVYQMMIDESVLEYYGKSQTGVFALMSFTNGGNTIAFNFYSPSADKLYRSVNQFTIELDETLFDDADEFDATEYVTQEELSDMPIPVVTPHSYKKESGNWYTSSASDSGSFANTGMSLRNYFMTSVAYNIKEDGIFYFGSAASLNKSNQIRLKVYVTDNQTMAKQVFPSDGSEYYTGSSSVIYYLQNVGGIEVKAGDSVVVAIAGTTNVWVTGNFTGSVVNDGTTVQTFSGTSAKTTVDAIFEGTNTDYSVGYTQLHTTITSNLTVKDTDDNTLKTVKTTKTVGTYVYYLPELSRPGKVFVGYVSSEGGLYPAGYAYQYDQNDTSLTFTAVFIDFAMFNSASVRMAEPTGLRFSTQIDSTQYKYLTDNNATVQLGTLIAKASDITTDGVVDYSLLTKECNVKKLNVVSTVQKTAQNGYTQFNAAVVELSEGLYSADFVARAYMTVTYADGSTQTVYAIVDDNARSVAGVAEKALSDVCQLKTSGYSYEVDGGYSPYSEDSISVLNGFAGL